MAYTGKYAYIYMNHIPGIDASNEKMSTKKHSQTFNLSNFF